MFTDIMNQLLPTLQLLKTKHFGFLHADLKARNIFVQIKDKTPIYKLADFDKSSIYFRGIRFHNISKFCSLAIRIYFYDNWINHYSHRDDDRS